MRSSCGAARAVRLLAALFFVAVPNVWAQGTPAPSSKGGDACRIALPHPKEKKSECGPRAAAGYDFAFCSLHYLIRGHSAPGPDLKGDPEAFKRKGTVYAQIAEALSGRPAFQKNTEFAKRYFDSLKDQGEMIGPSLEYVRRNCDNIEKLHAEAINELSREYKGKGK